MKVSINQVKINRVGINTAQVRGIRLSSAVANRGHKVDFPFSDSLVDYWNFGGKNNSDKDRDTIKGIKGGILTAYNFGWSLGSGYGLYKENYNNFIQLSGTTGIFTNTDHSIHITNISKKYSMITGIYYKAGETSPKYKIKITGLLADQKCLIMGYYTDNKGTETNVELLSMYKDGIYTVPPLIFPSDIKTGTGTGIVFNFAGDTDITIEQVLEYEGAIVTDGVDDYLKLDKTGYKVGTIIIKYVPIPTVDRWQYVLETKTERIALGYKSITAIENDSYNTNFDDIRNIEGYKVCKFNGGNIKNISTPLFISSNTDINEPLSMALYSIAIYDRALSDQEVQEVINFINYGTTNPIFALNFDNFAYKAVDYPDFATGKVTTNKIVVDSTTETFNGAIAVAMNPEADTGEPIEVPSYKIKVTGLNQYSVGEGNWAVGLMGMMIDSTKDPWTYPISKDGVYDIPAISLSDGIYNLGIMAQIAIDKPIEIEVLYDKNVTKSFPENKQIFP